MPSKKKKYNARFPPARIKKIMQTDEDVGKVAAAVPVIISRALELFIESLILKTGETTRSRNAKTLSPQHIKHTILSEKNFDFLKDLVASVPDVQQGDDEDSMTSGGPSDGQPKPRGRPRKNKGDGESKPPGKRGRPKKKQESSEDSATESASQDASDDEETEEDEDGDASQDEEEARDAQHGVMASAGPATTHSLMSHQDGGQAVRPPAAVPYMDPRSMISDTGPPRSTHHTSAVGPMRSHHDWNGHSSMEPVSIPHSSATHNPPPAYPRPPMSYPSGLPPPAHLGYNPAIMSPIPYHHYPAPPPAHMAHPNIHGGVTGAYRASPSPSVAFQSQLPTHVSPSNHQSNNS